MDAILGLSAYYHDSAAALLIDGEIVAAAHEERFTRTKHDSSFPTHATRYVLDEMGLRLDELHAISFYDKPLIKFERLLETYHGFAPRGLKSFLSAMPVWIKEKLFMRRMLHEELAKLKRGKPGRILFPEHHLSHAASAFYPSPFKDAAIVTIDGVGEWATTTIGYGSGNLIKIIKQLNFPHSIGLLYSAFTYWCGFKVNSGEYKLMGLAPYGNPEDPQTLEWQKEIKDNLVDIREDGSILLNMNYFDFATGVTMCNDRKWERLFGLPRRLPESDLTQPYMNMAYAIQSITEEIVFKIVKSARSLTGSINLAMAGGVALNCVANGKVWRKKIFEKIWIQPAAGDAGGSVGAAYAAWHIWLNRGREVNFRKDAMRGAYLGPAFSSQDIKRSVYRFNAVYQKFDNFDELCDVVAQHLTEGAVVGWFQGRMEFGPRALGNRSILGDPRNPEMQKKMNLKIKYREGFRPFAPSVLEEDIEEYFELSQPSPYMLLVAPVKMDKRHPLPEQYHTLGMYERLYHLRSSIPAVTHVDYSARIQSVSRETNLRYWKLISGFKDKTGCSLVVNTSFNVRGEPIVCSPKDAYICFMRTEMDYLVMDNLLFSKADQPKIEMSDDWIQEYALD